MNRKHWHYHSENTGTNRTELANISYGQNKTIEFEELGYGITSSRILMQQSLSSSPNKKLNTTDFGLELIKTTDSIPAQIGVQFAIMYRLNSKKNKTIPVNIIWVYPKGMTDVNGLEISETSYIIKKKTNIYEYSNYTLENECEVVKGKWVFKMIIDNEQVYEKYFYLY